jgi:UDP-glucose 4-epimerase
MEITNKVLVTGIKGFIGIHLCRHLKEVGIPVASSNTNYEKYLDVTKMDQLQFDEVGAIVHLAAKSAVTYSMKNPYETYHTNILGTLNLLEFARLHDIPKFIFVSTYVYGPPKYLPVDEAHPVNPHSHYNRSKLIAEQLCENYSNDVGINITVLRPFYVYGPGSKPDSFIASAIQQIVKNGRVILSGRHTKRDFLFINDFIGLFVSILNKFPDNYNVYNVGYGKSYTLKEASHILAKLLDKKITISYDNKMRPDDIIDMVADNSKVSREFKWKPSIGLEKGLELTVRNSKHTGIC